MKKLPRIAFYTLNICMTAIAALIMTVVSPVAPAFADLSQDDVDAIYNNWPAWVAGDDILCAGAASIANDPGGSGDPSKGTWDSGQQPPYILETFFIEVLKDIAQKRGVDPSNTVTEEHVVALVAFAIGEGGDINNHDIFNPLNTGIYAPDLASTAHNASGLQSFKSFDAGVEANARVMTGTNQRRLSDTLIKKDSTADQFMYALTYFNKYPGNKLWAEASLPPNDASYYQDRLSLVKQVRRDWAGTAGLVLGTPDFEFKTKTTYPSKLVFHPLGASAGGLNSGTATTSNDQQCQCGQAPSTAGNNNVIVIDPGHSGNSITVTDPSTGLKDADYPNHPEMEDVFNVAMKVRTQLQAAGYKVILTKGGENPKASDANDTVSLRQRADIANNAHAALAVSIHTDNGQNWANQNNLVYPQAVGLYRQKPDGSKVTFSNESVAKLSQQYAADISSERSTAEGHSVTLNNKDNNYAVTTIDGRGLAPGNIWMVQLFSGVPWVYNEAGGNSPGRTGLTDADQTKYANGLVNGIKKAVPIKQGGDTTPVATTVPDGCNTVSGKFMDIIKAYAWPTYHSAPYVNPYACNPAAASDADAIKCGQKMKPEYLAAIKAASARHEYVGGGQYPGVDCGGFVTRVFRDSGADKQYNKYQSNVVSQRRYLDEASSGPNAKYKKINGIKTGTPQPGDIWINDDASHTYIYVGEGVFDGNDSVSASFSTSGQSWRTPMASKAYDIKTATWYRPLFPLN
jgi:N-acetylmuramoyl-L-alanine amidase